MSKDEANMQHRYVEMFLNSTAGGSNHHFQNPVNPAQCRFMKVSFSVQENRGGIQRMGSPNPCAILGTLTLGVGSSRPTRQCAEPFFSNDL
uniref:Uncharacterized protein n=1 Tax=Oryzias sinensis TaxID=183150 RepID=A0A8C7ZVU1_9TELE